MRLKTKQDTNEHRFVVAMKTCSVNPQPFYRSNLCSNRHIVTCLATSLTCLLNQSHRFNTNMVMAVCKIQDCKIIKGLLFVRLVSGIFSPHKTSRLLNFNHLIQLFSGLFGYLTIGQFSVCCFRQKIDYNCNTLLFNYNSYNDPMNNKKSVKYSCESFERQKFLVP